MKLVKLLMMAVITLGFVVSCGKKPAEEATPAPVATEQTQEAVDETSAPAEVVEEAVEIEPISEEEAKALDQASKEFEAELEKIGAEDTQAQTTTEKAEIKAKEVVEEVKEGAKKATDTAKDVAKEVVEEAKEGAQKASDAAKDAVKDIAK